MPEWGVLQAADMLAYSRCRELFDGDLEIYNALHSIRKGVYKPVTFDCNLDLIRTVRDLRSTEAAAYKAWGARTPKPGRVIL
jgi:hypothetical protein